MTRRLVNSKSELVKAPLPKDGSVQPQAWSYERTLPGGRPYRSFV
jgi:hypothetical protein